MVEDRRSQSALWACASVLFLMTMAAGQAGGQGMSSIKVEPGSTAVQSLDLTGALAARIAWKAIVYDNPIDIYSNDSSSSRICFVGGARNAPQCWYFSSLFHDHSADEHFKALSVVHISPGVEIKPAMRKRPAGIIKNTSSGCTSKTRPKSASRTCWSTPPAGIISPRPIRLRFGGWRCLPSRGAWLASKVKHHGMLSGFPCQIGLTCDSVSTAT
jgi:hypothetical protein